METAVPAPSRDWALFLDIDGTLIDIAASADAVVVPRSLAATLSAAAQSVGGALALVSGRTLADIDRIAAPLALPCAAEHGAVIRLRDGTLEALSEDRAVPAAWRRRIREAARAWPGVRVEEKRYTVTMHYRSAPHYERAVASLADAVVAERKDEFEALPASMAREIRHRTVNKGDAVRRFMQAPPFAARLPVFVGDDVTDEDGYRAARALGGIALDVRDAFGGDTEKVRRWLASFGEAG